MWCCALNHAGTGHGIFCLEDLAASLVDHGQLRERERIVRFDLGDFFGVMNCVIELAVFVQADSQCHVTLDVLWMILNDGLQAVDAGLQVRVLQFHSGIVFF